MAYAEIHLQYLLLLSGHQSKYRTGSLLLNFGDLVGTNQLLLKALKSCCLEIEFFCILVKFIS